MIVPGSNDFVGYVGSTFDTLITIYPSADAGFTWTGNWVNTTSYFGGSAVIAPDNNAYLALRSNTNVNPVGDVTGAWSATPITPLNITGYTAVLTVGVTNYTTPINVQVGNSAGTVAVTMSPAITGSQTPGTQHYYLSLTQPNGALYYYMHGNFTWTAP